MASVSSSPEGGESIPPKRTDIGKFKCICCGARYWKKNKLIRRAAQCKGVRYGFEGVRWRCKAWRCRFNDQCPEANSACPICGAFKPPEFQPAQPALPFSQASSPEPTPRTHIDRDPAGPPSNGNYTAQSVRHQLEQPDLSSAQEAISVSQDIVPSGTVTLLPLLEGMTQRFLTEV